MNIFALLWSHSKLQLQVLAEDGIEHRYSMNEPALIGMHRYDLAIYGGSVITLRVPNGSRSIFFRSYDKGYNFERIEPVPGSGILHPNKCKVHANGVITAVDDKTVWVYPPHLRLWLRYDLPIHFEVMDISFDLQGKMHLVGAVMSEYSSAKENSAAYAFTDRNEVYFLQLALTSSDIELLKVSGGSEVFRRVDAEAFPLIVTSDCAWLFEDPSSFILTYSNYGWRLQKLENQSVRAWIREGTKAVSVFTSEGYCHHTCDGGKSWEEKNLIPAVCRAWEHLPPKNLLIMAVANSSDHWVLAVSSYDWQASPDKQILGSAVLVSFDRGDTFELKAITDSINNEFIALLSL